ncbi:MAG: hypothetical protein HYV28_00125 [Ignavibacteriales bacterium]|nr:hypothetical protein [Ignavibacteriales bacterium]
MSKFPQINLAVSDTALMRPFLDKSHLERFDNLIAVKNGRDKIVRELAHKFMDKINKQYITLFEGNPEELLGILIEKGALDSCYVISERKSIDGKILPLKTVLHEIFSYDMGAFILCLPSKLAYFEGEAIGEHWILEI